MSLRTMPNNKILVVDDEPSIRMLATVILETRDYKVQCAEDGLAALAALKTSLPDLIISDIRMPKMNGFEFLAVVRQRFPHIPVIAISGNFFGEQIPEGVLADTFLEKGNYSPDQLLERIADLLQRSPLRPKVEVVPNQIVRALIGSDGDANVNCPDCLRTFPVKLPLSAEVHTRTCVYCSTEVRFRLAEARPKSGRVSA